MEETFSDIAVDGRLLSEDEKKHVETVGRAYASLFSTGDGTIVMDDLAEILAIGEPFRSDLTHDELRDRATRRDIWNYINEQIDPLNRKQRR